MYSMRVQYVKSVGAWCVYDKGPTDNWYVRRRWVKFDTIEAARDYCKDFVKDQPIKIYVVENKT